VKRWSNPLEICAKPYINISWSSVHPLRDGICAKIRYKNTIPNACVRKNPKRPIRKSTFDWIMDLKNCATNTL
jgi:hypothetical protein